MLELENKQILIIGLGGCGLAACEFLSRSGAKVVGVDHANSRDLRRGANRLRPLGLDVELGVSAPPERELSLAKRVKRTFRGGEDGELIRAVGSLFTPCTISGSLLEALAEAAKNATSGDVVLLAPACSSWDQFQDHQHRGEVFCQAVRSIGRGVRGGTPNINGKTATAQQ